MKAISPTLQSNLGHALWTICASLILLGPGATRVAAQPSQVVVDAGFRYQTIEGFGACSIGWVPEMDAFYSTESFRHLYLTELGCTIYRAPLWAPILPDPIGNLEDLTYERFVSNNTRANSYINLMKNLVAWKPDIYIIASSWSPPAWMKTNNNLVGGGSLRPIYFEHFAKYMVEWVKFMRDRHGVDISALSIQNELLFAQDFESCVWTPADYLTVTRILGRRLREEGLGHVRLFGPEHMTSGPTANIDFVSAIMNDPEARLYFDVVASHGYVDGVTSDTAPNNPNYFFQRAVRPYGLTYWMTETSGEAPNHAGAISTARKMHYALSEGMATAYVYWQAFERNASQFGLRGIQTDIGKFHAFRHYSRWLQPGSERIRVQPSASDLLEISAFLRPDSDELVVVLINAGSQARQVEIEFRGLELPATLAVTRTTSANWSESLPPLPMNDRKVLLDAPALSIFTLTGSGSSWDQAPVTVPSEDLASQGQGGSHTLRIQSTAKRFVPVQSKSEWIQVMAETSTRGRYFTTPASVVLQLEPNPSETEDRSGTLLIDGMVFTLKQGIAQEPTPLPPSIFVPPHTADLGHGFKYNGLGYLYDLYFPFAYSFEAGTWIYVVADPTTREEDGFYAFDFSAERWFYAWADAYPYIFPLGPGGGIADPVSWLP